MATLNGGCGPPPIFVTSGSEPCIAAVSVRLFIYLTLRQMNPECHHGCRNLWREKVMMYAHKVLQDMLRNTNPKKLSTVMYFLWVSLAVSSTLTDVDLGCVVRA